MQPIDLAFAKDPNTLMLALVYGMLPAVLWIFFWKHEKKTGAKRGLLFFKCFLAGVLIVIPTLPVEQFVATLSGDSQVLTILWAASEEVMKFLAFAIVVLPMRYVEDPSDYPLTIMMVALGFAGFENALYFLQPIQTSNVLVLSLAGTTRYLSTTLLHALTSALVGFGIGCLYYRSRALKFFGSIVGLLTGIAVHSYFNLHLGDNGGRNSLDMYLMLWVIALSMLIMFEALRRMGDMEYRIKRKNALVKKLQRALAVFVVRAETTNGEEKSFTELLQMKKASARGLGVFVRDLRSLYASYLMSQGDDPKKATLAAAALIPESVSPKGAAGILTMLEGAGVGTDPSLRAEV